MTISIVILIFLECLKQAPEALIYSQKSKYDKVCLLNCTSSVGSWLYFPLETSISVVISIFNVFLH